MQLLDSLTAGGSRRARNELASAWEHLASATEQGARQLEKASRRRGALARDRALAARAALRGELTTSPWRWLGAGLAAGVVIGAVGTAVLTRRRASGDQEGSEQTATEAVRERASKAVAGVREQAAGVREQAAEVREQARTAVHNAASTVQGAAAAARNTVGRSREKDGDDGTAANSPPPATS